MKLDLESWEIEALVATGNTRIGIEAAILQGKMDARADVLHNRPFRPREVSGPGRPIPNLFQAKGYISQHVDLSIRKKK